MNTILLVSVLLLQAEMRYALKTFRKDQKETDRKLRDLLPGFATASLFFVCICLSSCADIDETQVQALVDFATANNMPLLALIGSVVVAMLVYFRKKKSGDDDPSKPTTGNIGRMSKVTSIASRVVGWVKKFRSK